MIIKWTAVILLLTSHAYAEEIQTSTTSNQSYIEDDFNPFVGLLAGAATSKDADQSSGEFGIEAGYQMLPIALAVEFSGSEYEDDGRLRDKTNLLIKGQYNFAGDSILTRYTFVGLGTGVIVRSDDTDFTFGPLAGFDVPVSGQAEQQHFSIGAAAKYLFTNSTPTAGVALNGTLKYWF